MKCVVPIIICLTVFFIHPLAAREPESFVILDPDSYSGYVDSFNRADDEHVIQAVPNENAGDFLAENIPLFECPEKDIERIYYYRWWTFRKHLRETPDGHVFTEFITPVGHAGIHNTISCALGHHIAEGRWLRNQTYLDEYVRFWFRKNDGGPQPHLSKFSSWVPYALYNRYLVTLDRDFLLDLLPDLVEHYRQWEAEKLLAGGLFWQFDVRDGMEESISGSRTARNARPTINSYMYGNALSLAETARIAGRNGLAETFRSKALSIKGLVQEQLWDADAAFFKVRFEDGSLSDAREEIGYTPWYFNLPDAGYEEAWAQILDTDGFKAPFGLTTAERRHPQFRSHGVGTCEWDGAVWPFSTTQTLVGMANVLRNYTQSYVTTADYYDALLTYAQSHRKNGKPYIGEYQDESTGDWLKGDNPRSRFYNHSTFCDLVITGLVGLCPRGDDTVEVHPLVPAGVWEWFCLDGVPYHGKMLTIIWDETGERYGKGAGLSVLADGVRIAHSPRLGRVTGKM